MKRIAIAAILVAAALVAVPTAASAAEYPTPVPPDSAVTTGVGQPIAVGVEVPGWSDGLASVVVDGPGTAVILPIAVTSTGNATVYGGNAYFTVNPSVVGVYSATLTQGLLTASVTVTAIESTAYTGVSDPTPYIWLGGGLAVLGIAAVITAVAVRRQHAKAGTPA